MSNQTEDTIIASEMNNIFIPIDIIHQVHWNIILNQYRYRWIIKYCSKYSNHNNNTNNNNTTNDFIIMFRHHTIKNNENNNKQQECIDDDVNNCNKNHDKSIRDIIDATCVVLREWYRSSSSSS